MTTKARKTRPPKLPLLSVFSGAGGMDLGFRQSGFRTVLAIDLKPSAVKTLNFNAKRKIAIEGDLLDLTNAQIVDMIGRLEPESCPRGIIGGPPCQCFSIGNTNKRADDSRLSLPKRYADLVAALESSIGLDFFVFENVPGIRNRRFKELYSEFKTSLDTAGFNVSEGALDARSFGVPQRRKRVFIVGIHKMLSTEFRCPAGSGEITTVQDAIGDLPEPSFFGRKLNRTKVSYHPNHWAMNPRSPKFKSDLPTKGRSFRRLEWEEPSPTVAYGNREMHVHPNGRRRVSVYEGMLMQGFPPSYEMLGNFSEQVSLVSDAVPPPLAAAIGNEIRAKLYTPRRKLQLSLLRWFRRNQRRFPWRDTVDPFKIMVAEKLLQQTAVNPRVVESYDKLTTRYPSPASLAAANLRTVRSIVDILGLRSRSKELRCMSKQLLSNFSGVVPGNYKDLLSIPGVGEYSARAILSFAFGQDYAVVDTNVSRFLYRFFGLGGDKPSNPARSRRLTNLATSLMPLGESREYNLAILDLTALVCTVRSPSCDKCPVRSTCSHYRNTVGKGSLLVEAPTR